MTKQTAGQIARDTKNRERLVAALQEHGAVVLQGSPVSGIPGATVHVEGVAVEAVSAKDLGEILYSFLDAAVGELSPSQADAARKNAIRWLRRHAKRAQGAHEA